MYSSEYPFTQLGEIELPNVEDSKNPNDMAACPKNSCLYIICTNGEIYRVSVPDNTIKKIEVIVEYPPYTISVSADGTLIIPQDRLTPDRYTHRDVVAPQLLMLTINSDLTVSRRMLSLPGEWKDMYNILHRVRLHHAVQLKSGNFLVSYGESCIYIGEVSRSGTFIERENLDKLNGSSGHLNQSSENNQTFIYLTSNEVITNMNSALEEIPIEDEFKNSKLLRKEPTRLDCFNNNSYLIGTRHGGAYILTGSNSAYMPARSQSVVSKDNCSDSELSLVKLDTGGYAEVSGVAELANTLYVMCRKSKTIFCYKSDGPFERLDDIELLSVHDPNDMAACPKNSCLYIICTNGELYRVSVLDNSADKIDVIIKFPPYTLSVSAEGTLIIPQDRLTPDRYIQRDIVASQLLMLTINNDLTVSKIIISLPGEWKDKLNVPHRVKLHHAVQLKSGNFLVSYGESCVYVCEVTRGGYFIERSNHDKLTGSSGHLTQPSENTRNFIYLTRSEIITNMNSMLEEIPIEEKLKDYKLIRKEPTRLNCFDKNSYLIGTKHGGAYILTDCNSVCVPIRRQYEDNCSKLLVKLETGGYADVSGVAELANILYVMCRKSKAIIGYKSEGSFQRLDDIELPNVGDPNDMAACQINSCLYVICTDGVIFKINIPSNIITKIDYIIQYPPFTISVSQEGSLIIPQDTLRLNRYTQKEDVAPQLLSLTVNKGTSKIFKRFTSLPGEWKDEEGITHRVKLHHAVQLPSGNFLVSYGETGAYICEVTSGGNFIERSSHAKFKGSSGHMIVTPSLQSNNLTTVKQSHNTSYFVYLTQNDGVTKLNDNLDEIKLSNKLDEIRDEEELIVKDKLKRKEFTRLCCFNKNSFLIGTRHGGAYILFSPSCSSDS